MKNLVCSALMLLVFSAPALAAGVTFASPAGGETWLRGTVHTIQYTYTAPMADDCVSLFRKGAFIGYVATSSISYEAGSVVSHQWQVGKLKDLNNQNTFWAPVGGGYTLRAGQMAQADHGGFSKPFAIGIDISLIARIRTIYYNPFPPPDGCPQCLVLDLGALRRELVKLDDALRAELYWHGAHVADLGRSGGRQALAARLQVRLEPDALAAARRGEAFELRLLGAGEELIHSQAVRLIALGRR